MSALPEFNANKIKYDIRRFVKSQVLQLAINTVKELREATPVDTGWARANWIVHVGGKPPTNPVGQYPGKGVKNSPEVAEAEANALSFLAFAEEIGSLESSWARVVYIVNNVPYIVYIDGGHSHKAPTGFVQIAIEKAIRVTEIQNVLGVGKNEGQAWDWAFGYLKGK